MSNSLRPHGLWPPGYSVHGIHQARILEWVVILFSRGASQPRGQTCVYHISGRFFSIWATREVVPMCGVLSHFSRVWLCVTLWTSAYQVSLSMGFSRKEYWSGLPCPSPGDLPDLGIEPGSPALQARSLLPEPSGRQCKEEFYLCTFIHTYWFLVWIPLSVCNKK